MLPLLDSHVLLLFLFSAGHNLPKSAAGFVLESLRIGVQRWKLGDALEWWESYIVHLFWFTVVGRDVSHYAPSVKPPKNRRIGWHEPKIDY